MSQSFYDACENEFKRLRSRVLRKLNIRYRLRLRSPIGVIYLRFRPHTPEEPASSILLNLLQTEGLQFQERFRVVEGDRIRQRPLP